MTNIIMLSTIKDQEIKEVLENFGLSEKERVVYLGLLSQGTSSMTPLAKITGLKPTTVQSVANRLHEMGIILITKKHSRTIYSAKSPTTFKEILVNQIHEFDNIIPLLKSLEHRKSDDTRINIYYRERMVDIFNQALNSETKIVYEIVAAKELQNIIGEKFHFTKRRIANGIRLNSLRIESQEIKKYSPETHRRELREALFLPRELTFKANVLFWDNTVAFFSSKSEGLAWTVESTTIREMIEQIFRLLWSVSRRMDASTTPTYKTVLT